VELRIVAQELLDLDPEFPEIFDISEFSPTKKYRKAFLESEGSWAAPKLDSFTKQRAMTVFCHEEMFTGIFGIVHGMESGVASFVS
jgi:hypothetical protein